MSKKDQLSQKIVDYIMCFEFDCRKRSIQIADKLKLEGRNREKFLNQIRDNLPPIHLEFWQIDEMMRRNGVIKSESK